MKNLKTAVIGVGVMGSKYAMLLQNHQISGMELAALTRIRPSFRKQSRMVTLPEADSPEERSFEQDFEACLVAKGGHL